MNSRRVAALLLAGAFVAGCAPPPDDETRLRERLATMIEALESGDIDDFMAPIASDFVAGERGLDRRAVALLARRERLARESIRIRRVDTEVERVGEQRALVRFRALATGGTGLLPDEGRFWAVETGWRKRGGDWEMISANWQPGL
jgi:hypothetical protein